MGAAPTTTDTGRGTREAGLAQAAAPRGHRWELSCRGDYSLDRGPPRHREEGAGPGPVLQRAPESERRRQEQFQAQRQPLILPSHKGLTEDSGEPCQLPETGLSARPQHPGPQKAPGRRASKQPCLSPASVTTVPSHHSGVYSPSARETDRHEPCGAPSVYKSARLHAVCVLLSRRRMHIPETILQQR